MERNGDALPGIDILNTGYGDFELRFDPDSPADVEKAKQAITDMLKRGYAIFVMQDGQTRCVRKFDRDKNVNIIGSTPAEEVPIAETKATASDFVSPRRLFTCNMFCFAPTRLSQASQ